MQSDWMANNKTKAWWPALCHGTVYSLPFAFVGSWAAVLVIWSTHVVIDRLRLARYVAWAKNMALDPMALAEEPMWRDYVSDAEHREALGKWIDWNEAMRWQNCSKTGYTAKTPDFLAVWLLIACDNTMHLAINYAALAWL